MRKFMSFNDSLFYFISCLWQCIFALSLIRVHPWPSFSSSSSYLFNRGCINCVHLQRNAIPSFSAWPLPSILGHRQLYRVRILGISFGTRSTISLSWPTAINYRWRGSKICLYRASIKNARINIWIYGHSQWMGVCSVCVLMSGCNSLAPCWIIRPWESKIPNKQIQVQNALTSRVQ